MPGVTAALLGNLDARRELGKVGTQSDIHLHEWKEGAVQGITIVPASYPDTLKPLSYAVLNCDAAVVVVSEVNARLGEQILALDASGVAHGIVVLTNYVQPDQIKPLLKNTGLASWPMQEEADYAAVRAHLAKAPARAGKDAFVQVPIDHHFNVKGVGAVILGVVKQGILKKGETLYAYPDKVIAPVRSIQIHDVDVSEAVPGDRVGLALRNTPPEALDRGMVLAPSDAPLVVLPTGSAVKFRLRRSTFSKQPLGPGAVVQVGTGMQYVPLRLASAAPGPGQEGVVEGTLDKGLVMARDDRAILFHQDAPLRVVGPLRLES